MDLNGKELSYYFFSCDWDEGGYHEEISVLASTEQEAREAALLEAESRCGAPLNELSLVALRHEKADLGLLLYQSVKGRQYQEAAEYIEMGADVNYRFLPEEYNFTALHMAAYGADMRNIQMLVEAGCDLNPLDTDRCTPLDRAIARHNYPHVVSYLVEHGAMRGLDVILHHARRRSEETAHEVTGKAAVIDEKSQIL